MTDDLDRRWIAALRRHSEHAGGTGEAWQSVLRRAEGVAPSSHSAVRLRTRVLIAAAVIALLGGTVVVVASRRSGPDATRLSTNTTTVPTKSGEGRLVVVNTYTDPTDLDGRPSYVEGGVGVTQVWKGDKVVAELRGWALDDRKVLDIGLPAGTYELRNQEVACGASGCSQDADGIITDPGDLDPPPLEQGCSTAVTVEADVATTVEMRRGLDDPTDLTACSFAVGTPTRVVVAASGLPSGEEGVIHRFSIGGGPENNTITEGTIGNDSTALLVDRPIARGEYKLRVEHYDCQASCPDVAPDGRPKNGAKPLAGLGCDAPFNVGNGTTRVLITVKASACTVTRPPSLPALTVPPAWSLRIPLPTTCGSDTLHATAPSIGNAADPGKEARQCFLRAHQAFQPMELVSAERTATGTRQVIWRTRGSDLKVIRPPRTKTDAWKVRNCGLSAAPAPEWATAGGCGQERQLSLDPD